MKLKIRTAPISIRVLTVDSKRMTKSVFNQIQREQCFDFDYNFIGDEIIGFVYDKDQKWLLWMSKGELRKNSLVRIELFSKIEFEKVKEKCYVESYYSRGLLDKLGDYYIDEGDRSYLDNSRNAEKCIVNAKSFMNQIRNEQLFISI